MDIKVYKVYGKKPNHVKYLFRECMWLFFALLFGIIGGIGDISTGCVSFIFSYIFMRYIWCLITINMYHREGVYDRFLVEYGISMEDNRRDGLMSRESNLFFSSILIVLYLFRGIWRFIKRCIYAISEFANRYEVLFSMLKYNKEYKIRLRTIKKSYPRKSVLYTVDFPTNGIFDFEVGREQGEGSYDLDRQIIKYVYRTEEAENAFNMIEEIDVGCCRKIHVSLWHNAIITFVEKRKGSKKRKISIPFRYTSEVEGCGSGVIMYPTRQIYNLVMALKNNGNRVIVKTSKRRMRKKFALEGNICIEGSDCFFDQNPRNIDMV